MEYKTWKQWLSEARAWITKEQDAFYGAILLIESTCICIFAWSSSWILYWGLFLQVLGIAVAVHNLLKIRITCNQEPLRIRFCKWLDAFPSFKMKPIVCEGNIKAPRAQLLSTLIQPYDLIDDDSIEGRIRRLEDIMEELRNESVKGKSEIEKLKNNVQNIQVAENEARETMRSEIRKEIEHLFTQDIIGSLVGLVLVMYGVVLSTLADWIFSL